MEVSIIEVVRLERLPVSRYCEWEGETADGRAVHVLYRWGFLRVAVGETFEDAVDVGARPDAGRVVFSTRVAIPAGMPLPERRMRQIISRHVTLADQAGGAGARRPRRLAA